MKVQVIKKVLLAQDLKEKGEVMESQLLGQNYISQRPVSRPVVKDGWQRDPDGKLRLKYVEAFQLYAQCICDSFMKTPLNLEFDRCMNFDAFLVRNGIELTDEKGVVL